jgi:hypothetical protein
MGRRRGGGRGRRDVRKPGGPDTEYYIGTESDLGYSARSRQRVRQETQRRWVIRLAILAVIVFACWMWGPTVVDRLRQHGRETMGDLQGTGQKIREGRDERSGANFDSETVDSRPYREQPSDME